MRRICMLTLSIAEGIPGSETFEVNCLHLTNKSLVGQIVSFERTKEEIFDEHGKVIWDLGRITLMEGASKKAGCGKNTVYEPSGNVELYGSKEIPKETLKSILDHNAITFSKFSEAKDLRFAVIKPRSVISIDEDSGVKEKRKQRMTLDLDDDHRQEVLLNKDYRWVHYWRQIPDEIIYTKQDAYCNLYNSPGKDLYLIVRKYYFDKPKWPRYWISGMHWL